MSALTVALAHYRRRAQTARLLEQQAARLWQQVQRGDIAGSWAQLMPELAATITLAQHTEAQAADAYVAASMAAEGETGAAEADIVASAWTGVASDGRPLASLLMQPVISAKTALADGRGLQEALNYGQAVLQMITSTQVTDAGRTADQVAMLTRHSQGYVRMVVGNACSRCAVLAGRWYRWDAGFDRHYNCKCVGIPAAEDHADDVRTSPDKYFRSLSASEQDRIFGQAGAQAIRDGADMGQVVNARSGMYAAGGKKYTASGTSRRALYGGYEITPEGKLVRRPRGIKAPPRLMPEAIYKQAAGDRAEALRLLHQYGYVTDPAKAKAATAPVAAIPKKVAAKPKAANLGEYHLPGDPVEDLAKAARQAAGKDATRAKLSGGASAETEVVTLPNGRKLVTKRGSDFGDKSPEGQADVRHQADAEQLASMVGRAIGAPVVRVYRSDWDRVWMDFEEGHPIGDFPSEADKLLFDGRDGQLIGLLDHLIANSDRNGGNLLVNNGRLMGIDHGWSWPPDLLEIAGPAVRDTEAAAAAGHYSRDRGRWIDNPLTEHDIRILRDLLTALRPNFDRLNRGAWLDYSLARLELIAAHARGTVNLIG